MVVPYCTGVYLIIKMIDTLHWQLEIVWVVHSSDCLVSMSNHRVSRTTEETTSKLSITYPRIFFSDPLVSFGFNSKILCNEIELWIKNKFPPQAGTFSKPTKSRREAAENLEVLWDPGQKSDTKALGVLALSPRYTFCASHAQQNQKPCSSRGWKYIYKYRQKLRNVDFFSKTDTFFRWSRRSSEGSDADQALNFNNPNLINLRFKNQWRLCDQLICMSYPPCTRIVPYKGEGG